MEQSLNKVLPTVIKEKIFTKQMQILHKNLLVSIPANFICTGIVFINLYQHSHSYLVLSWFMAVIFISVFRLIAYYFYHRIPKKENLHLFIFILGMSISAALWGIADSILMPVDSLERQMIIIVIVAGVTAGGIQTLNANLKASLIYVCLTVTPLCIWLLLQNKPTFLLLGVAILAYLLFMLATSIRGYKLLLNALTLQYENLDLIDKLSVTNTKLLYAYKEQEKHEHKIILLNKMNDMLQVCQNLHEAYTVIPISGKELFPQLNGGLFILNNINNQFEMITQWGDKPLLKSTISITDCWALRKGHEYYINNPVSDLTCNHFTSSLKTSICLPLSIQMKGIGLLILYSNEIDSLSTGGNLQIIHSFGEVIQLSLTNIKLRESLYEQSIHDALTGLYNRRYLDETLNRELQRSKRENTSICVAMLDLDNFKRFNDTHGHEAGDEALKLMGALLMDNFRGSDISCRFGGEEFLVVMVNSDLDSARFRLDQFRESMKNSKLYIHGHTLPSISVSIGVAVAPQHGSTAEGIIHAADIALYAAKQAGKDRVECAINSTV